jgi:hypothetical protein
VVAAQRERQEREHDCSGERGQELHTRRTCWRPNRQLG